MESVDQKNLAVLAPVRFGEFLRDRAVITEEQWLAALAEHWSRRAVPAQVAASCRLGDVVVEQGVVPQQVVEAEARAYHGLDVVEVDVDVAPEPRARHLRTTVPLRAVARHPSDRSRAS
ncbi:MAG: hypothetical protein R2939_08925 [Kofleriaceae bacterium]